MRVNSAFAIGDKISWSTITNGKVARLQGNIIDIVDDTMVCVGKCIATDRWWRDYVLIYDKSICKEPSK